MARIVDFYPPRLPSYHDNDTTLDIDFRRQPPFEKAKDTPNSTTPREHGLDRTVRFNNPPEKKYTSPLDAPVTMRKTCTSSQRPGGSSFSSIRRETAVYGQQLFMNSSHGSESNDYTQGPHDPLFSTYAPSHHSDYTVPNNLSHLRDISLSSDYRQGSLDLGQRASNSSSIEPQYFSGTSSITSTSPLSPQSAYSTLSTQSRTHLLGSPTQYRRHGSSQASSNHTVTPRCMTPDPTARSVRPDLNPNRVRSDSIVREPRLPTVIPPVVMQQEKSVWEDDEDEKLAARIRSMTSTFHLPMGKSREGSTKEPSEKGSRKNERHKRTLSSITLGILTCGCSKDTGTDTDD
ncbi:MAG: hypothetical protein M1834_003497 [Cirrosporium novae-zelandiae]|nr:MAG: hypothetical protein M1834_003497 [Cirrosporium novae-zelandiae]